MQNNSSNSLPTQHAALGRRDAVVIGVCLLLVLGLTLPDLMTGWFPHDEGQIGQAAERFLQGQLPHRDFDDMYTGLLTVLHGVAFQLLGIRTESTRWMLLFASIPFLISIYRISRRWLPPVDAGGLLVLCGMWGIRLNPESLPSWYILFLTAGMLDAILTFLCRRRLRWLFVAGLLAGIAVLFKLTGIFLVAAGVLILMDYEQRQCPQDGQRSLLFSGWILFCCSVYCLAALRLWSASDALMSALHLTIPAVATGLAVLLGEWRRGRGPCGSRLARWLPLQATFAAGVLLPLAGWILWYWQADALSSLYDGLVVLPRRRLEYAGAPFPGLAAFAVSAVVTAAACLAVRRNRRQDPSYRISHGQIWLRLGVCLVVVAAGYHVPQVRIVIFQAVRNLAPLVSVILLVLALRCRCMQSGTQVFAVAATLVMGAQVQFPFALDTYFLYVAPLVFLGCSSAIRHLRGRAEFDGQPFTWPRLISDGLCLLAWLSLKSVVPLGTVTVPTQDSQGLTLQMDRCGLTVEASLGEVYQRLITKIQTDTAPEEAILAGPDCPEVYFLSGRRNPTRVFYDFFQPDLLKTDAELNELASRERIRMVVVKQPFLREFSRDTPPLESWARAHFGPPITLGFIGRTDSDAPALFNVYTDSTAGKTDELPAAK